MDKDRVTGRARGGIARAEALSPERRSEIARKGAIARHSGLLKKATHGSPHHPLRIGDIKIPCYVLEDGTRVLSQRGLQTSIGMSIGGGSRVGEQRIATFIEGLGQKGLEVSELLARIRNPIRFVLPSGARGAYGYEATILTAICDLILAARQKGILQPQQRHLADQCEILVRGFADLGIIALVDEATGYQRDRAKNALAKILEDFIAKELQPYLPTFPAEFYEQIFRLRGIEYPSGSVKRPQYFGMLTNDVVYKRLAPGVLEELKRVTPRNEAGRPKSKYFQSLTSNMGYPKLRERLGSIVTMMKLSTDWHDFMEKLDRLHPPQIQNAQYSFDYERSKDDGKGL